MKTSEFEIIELENFPRKDHFKFFSTMANPYTGLTVNIDVTEAVGFIKENGYPFFLTILWSVCRAANQVPEFRQRAVDGKIRQYKHCNTSHTVSKEDGTYAYCSLDCQKPLAEFIEYGKAENQLAAMNGNIDDGEYEDLNSLIFISTVPWVTYVDIYQPTPSPADSIPRIVWGRYFEQGDKLMMLVTVLVNHALVDGLHIARFYKKLEETLNNLGEYK